MVGASAAVKPLCVVALNAGSDAPYTFVPPPAVTVAGAFVMLKLPATYATV